MTDPAHRSFLRWLKLAFALELLLLAVITGTALYSLESLREQVRAIVDEQQQRLTFIHEMRLAVRERMLRLNMLLIETDPFRRDDYRQQVHLIASRFMTARSEVEAHAREPEERVILASVRTLSREVGLIVDRILALDEAGQVDQARALLLSEAVPRQEQVLARTDELLRFYAQRNRDAIERLRAHYHAIVAGLGAMGLLAGVLTLATGVVVVRVSRRDRARLLDELAAHAATEARLRALSDSLEEQVAERTRALQQTADLLREAQRIGRMGHWEWDIESGRLTWSDEVYRLFGLPVGSEQTFETFLSRVHPDDRKKVQQTVADALASGEPQTVVHRILLPDGSVRYMREQGLAQRDALGFVRRMVGTVQDVTETEQLQQKLWDLAHHDALTGLPNRLVLMDRLQQAVALGRRTGQGFSVVLFDLDGFKAVNDECGHQVGDALLAEVARRVRGVLRESDTLCRYGGDEFVGIFPGVAPGADLEALFARIEGCFNEPFALGCQQARVRASIGVACFPLDGSDPDELLRHADADMYRAKRGPDG